MRGVWGERTSEGDIEAALRRDVERREEPLSPPLPPEPAAEAGVAIAALRGVAGGELDIGRGD